MTATPEHAAADRLTDYLPDPAARQLLLVFFAGLLLGMLLGNPRIVFGNFQIVVGDGHAEMEVE